MNGIYTVCLHEEMKEKGVHGIIIHLLFVYFAYGKWLPGLFRAVQVMKVKSQFKRVRKCHKFKAVLFNEVILLIYPRYLPDFDLDDDDDIRGTSE